LEDVQTLTGEAHFPDVASRLALAFDEDPNGERLKEQLV
jgi:hypothetical protein